MNQQKNKSFWGRLLDALSSSFTADALVNLLEKKAVKAALKKLAISGGLRAWLVTFVVEELVDEADEHIIEPAFRKVGFASDFLDGAKVYKKVKNAQDVDQWVDSLNDV